MIKFTSFKVIIISSFLCQPFIRMSRFYLIPTNLLLFLPHHNFSFRFYLTPTNLFYFLPHHNFSFRFYLTPTPLLLERGYLTDILCITLLLLKEKEMEDEVKIMEKEMEDEVKIMEKEMEDEVKIKKKKAEDLLYKFILLFYCTDYLHINKFF